MKKYTFTRYFNTSSKHDASWLWSLLWKTFLYLIMLLLFILLFCIKGCGSDANDILSPYEEYITPEGDTLRGHNPIIMNPGIPRNELPDNPEDTSAVQWPIGIIGERDPNLPDRDNNRIPVIDPEDGITDPEDGRVIADSHLFVILDSDANDETFNKFAGQLSGVYDSSMCSIVYYNTLSKTLLLKVLPEMRNEIKIALPQKITDISFYVVEVELLTSNFRPNDKAFGFPKYSWHYQPVQAYDAWDITTGNSNVTVAVIDSYFDLNHPDLNDVKTVHKYSVERGNSNVYPSKGLMFTAPDAYLHGTHVAGIIFAEMNNIEGLSGIAPSCTFMPISLGRNLNSYAQIEAILYAIYKGADVINLSIGLQFDKDFVKRISLSDQVKISAKKFKEKEKLWDYIFKLCDERNVTIVWSAGNQNILSSMDVSKRNPNTIRVEAVDKNLRKSDYSNFGVVPRYNINNSTISAPGNEIVSTIPCGDYFPMQGTSMAAPIVTGAVALMKSLNNNLTNKQVVEILKATSKPLEDKNIGGLLQIKDALKMVQSEFLKFEDVISNPQMLVGEWEATTNFNVLIDGEQTGEHVRLTMTFSTPYDGVLKLHYEDGENIGDVCSARLKADFANMEITIRDLENPVSERGNRFKRSIFRCTPDDNGYLKASQEYESSEALKFNLRKIQ